MEVRITKKASKELNKIPNALALKISKELLNLGVNPFTTKSKKLRGENNYRIRIGVYRAIYTTDKKKKIIKILRIKHRKDVYR